MKALRINIFARKLGYPNARDRKFQEHLDHLINKQIVKVEQSGFRAHSCHHPKIVVLLKDLEIRHCSLIKPEPKTELDKRKREFWERMDIAKEDKRIENIW